MSLHYTLNTWRYISCLWQNVDFILKVWPSGTLILQPELHYWILWMKAPASRLALCKIRASKSSSYARRAKKTLGPLARWYHAKVRSDFSQRCKNVTRSTYCLSSRCLVDETRKLTSRRSVLVELGGDEVGYRSGKSSWRKDSVDVENKVPTLRVLVDLFATAGQYNSFCWSLRDPSSSFSYTSMRFPNEI